MTNMLQEFCDSRGVKMRVDREAGVIRGVKVLGLESRNGRSYLPEALAAAARLYEDAKVNVNHPHGNPGGPRDYQDRIGTVRNVTLRTGEGLFADFHFNPKHALAEQLIWDAERSPENVGFSHNVEARCVRRGDRWVVEAITRVQSVDLVADPATTRGLFESAETSTNPPPTATPQGQQIVETSTPEQAPPSDELRQLRDELTQLRVQEATRQKHDLVHRLLREYELPGTEANDPRSRTVSSPEFLNTLLAAADEHAVRALVEDRARLVRMLSNKGPAPAMFDRRPCSREQHSVCATEPLSAKRFVEAIT